MDKNTAAGPWIDAAARKPRKGVPVLVCQNITKQRRSVSVAIYTGDDVEWEACASRVTLLRVTHWAELNLPERRAR